MKTLLIISALYVLMFISNAQIEGMCFTGFEENCAKCMMTQNADEYCVECKAGFTLDNGKCVSSSSSSQIQCSSNCTECKYDIYNNVICTKCTENVGLYLTPENVCSPCPSQCEECASIGGDMVFLTCTKCKAGSPQNAVCSQQNIKGCNAYYIDENGNNVVCGGCESGYIMDGFTCNKCPSGCTSCYAPAIPIGFEQPHINCGGCTDGSTPNNGVCGSCPNNCPHCQYGMDLKLGCFTPYQPQIINPGGPIILANNTNIGFLQ